jgi:pimeloyl-ACP methyl ester carboxylesterase
MFERLADALAGNPALVRRNRFAKLTLAVASGDKHWTVKTGGEGIAVEAAKASAPDVSFAAPPAQWADYASAAPAPGSTTLATMMRLGKLKVDGDMLRFGQHLMFLEELFASLRPTHAATTAAIGTPTIEAITGRYLRLDLAGRPHRIYFEEAGHGIPLICLHTAGADGRQYRGVLNDPEITRHFRVIAFDLPWHGKSSPPPGFEREVYRLTTDLYVDTVMTVCRALQLDRPVVMGCSIGGRAVLHLALRHAADFRAAIGLQSALFADPGADPRMRDLELIHRPDVHGSDAAATTVAGLIAPSAPTSDKWETLWHYMQGGPGIFMGDLHYYFTDGDLRNGLAEGIDTAKCPLYLLTGEYDISATPALTAELAKLVKATHFEVMKGMGHFPMSEDPQQFRKYLIPVLEKIRAQ